MTRFISEEDKRTNFVLNIYLLERMDSVSWDEYSSLVVSSESAELAKKAGDKLGDLWTHPDNLKVTRLGVCVLPDAYEGQILHSDFNRG